MKRKIIAISICIFIALLLGLLYFAIPIEIKKIPMQLSVLENNKGISINTDADAIKFGGIPTGGYAWRKITLNGKITSKAYIFVEGPLAPWIEISDDEFILKKGESREVKFTIYVPKNATPGSYHSNATIAFFRPLPWQD